MRDKIYLKTSLFKRLLLSLMCSLMILSSYAQEDLIRVAGVVTGTEGPLSGVTISLQSGRALGSTDVKGYYEFEIPRNSIVIFNHLAYEKTEIKITDYKPNSTGVYVLDLVLNEKIGNEIDEAVVVGFGTQKKASLVSSITVVNPKELKGPSSNLTTMLAGRVSGMIAYQRSGEPGADNAQFFIRGLGSFGSGKTDPLILIDGIESTATDMARLQPDDISAFSVLKDATAAAVYGARGANGVVLITTKTGAQGKTKFMVR